MSVQARDRKLETWYSRVKNGEIKLPRFQRFEAWDRNRICSLLNMVVHDLPLGITLLLEVDQEQFISRYLATAEINVPPFPRVIEHLLDGQQRITAIWRALHNNYDLEKYFIYIREFDTTRNLDNQIEDGYDDWSAQEAVVCQSRWISRRTGKLMPLWADEPEECLKRGYIPFELLRPEDISTEISKWIVNALEFKKPKHGLDNFEIEIERFSEEKQKLTNLINGFRSTVKHYNLPFLALASDTSKDVALNVFINMNTNSKPLSQYDIIVAEIEGVKDTSLHDLQSQLDSNHPSVKRYADLSYLILNTSALMQEKVPNRVGIWDMDKRKVVEDWDKMMNGLSRMASFLESHNIFDDQRLPTNAVLSVIAALFTNIPEIGDKAGQSIVLLKKYLWSSFFTDRYENAAASRAYADYIALLGIINQKNKPNTNTVYTENDVPVLNRSMFPIATEEQLINVTWPKNVSIRGRGILAVANYFNAHDFADGSAITAVNVQKREYHHIFPDALLSDANNILGEEINSWVALNCALITGATNRVIGRKNPMTYLKERYNWTSEPVVEQRLGSHLIPVEELKAGSYSGFSDMDTATKIKKDYEAFLIKRSKMISKAIEKLTLGEDVRAADFLKIEIEENSSLN
ncbi:MAG: DUF262 domain-containing protein [Bacteroidota bacterium]